MNPVIHFELPADDSERVQRFYKEAFDWRTTPLGPEAGDFVQAFTVDTDEETRIPTKRGAINGGFYPRTAPDQTTRFTILVDDITEAIGRVEGAGGTLVSRPFELPGVGLFAMVTDTEGNLLQLTEDFTVKRLPE